MSARSSTIPGIDRETFFTVLREIPFTLQLGRASHTIQRADGNSLLFPRNKHIRQSITFSCIFYNTHRHMASGDDKIIGAKFVTENFN